mmetsp:Transcript_112610/g.304018  ORF Transcript_112610/g.304018 Transcript_112610/m.304018 type:complete len:91 (-) Transcript_112610:21-293(-)
MTHDDEEQKEECHDKSQLPSMAPLILLCLLPKFNDLVIIAITTAFIGRIVLTYLAARAPTGIALYTLLWGRRRRADNFEISSCHASGPRL